MYDWIKVLIPKKYWHKLRDFRFYDGVQNKYRIEDYGEVSKECFYYKGICVCFRKNQRIELSGSFHFFKNEGKHNADDFTLEEFQQVLDKLGSVFGIDWEECEVLNFEFGVNITPTVPSLQIIRGCYLYAKTEFELRHQSHFKAFHLERYTLKIYDKANWCKVKRVGFTPKTEVLRVEIKTKKRKRSKDFGGVFYVTDLLKKDVLDCLLRNLFNAMNKVVFYDSTIDLKVVLKDNPRSKIKDMKDFSNWQAINTNPRYRKGQKLLSKKERETMDTKYKRWVKTLRETALKHGNNIQVELCGLIQCKWLEQNSQMYPNLLPVGKTSMSRNLPL